MDRNALGWHVAGDPDMLVRRVCDNAQGFFGDPTGDERIAGHAV